MRITQRLSRTVVLLSVFLVVLVSTSATAALLDTDTVSLTVGRGGVTASVYWTGDLYYYEYVYTADKLFSAFAVGNVTNLPYTSASSDNTTYFPTSVNPVYSGSIHYEWEAGPNSLIWNAVSTVPAGNTVVFSFYSIYGYSKDVQVTASGGGPQGTAFTIGMVPEPGALSMLGMGILGASGAAIRRRFRR